MTKTKLLYIAIFALILLNLGQWFFLSGGGHRPAPREIIIHKLHFSPTQITAYDEIIKTHEQAISQKDAEIKAAKNALYQLLNTRNEAEEARLFTQLTEAKISIEKLHFEHFLAIKALCTTEQQPLFEALVGELTKIFAPPQPRKKPQDK